MADGGIAITKQLGTVEDLALGVGSVLQERLGEEFLLTEINGAHIPYSATLSLNQKIQELESGADISQQFAWESEAWKRTSNSFATQPIGELVRLYTSNGDGTFTIEELVDTYSSLHWANSSSLYADDSQLKAWIAEADALTSLSYATEAEDTVVNLVTSDGDGTFTYTPQTSIYSALHYAAKSATFNPALYALLTGAIFTGQVKGITPVAVEDLTRKDYVDNLTVHKSNVDQIKIGSLTVGESIAVTNWEYLGTTITLTVVSHNAKVGDTIYISGLVADIGNAPNETAIVTSVTATTIVYTASFTPTATADTGTTVNNASVKYGDLTTKGDIPVATNESETLWSGSAGVTTITVADMSEYENIIIGANIGANYMVIPYELFKLGATVFHSFGTSATDVRISYAYASDTSIIITVAIGATLTKVYGQGK